MRLYEGLKVKLFGKVCILRDVAHIHTALLSTALKHVTSFILSYYLDQQMLKYRGADKSLARPGRKQSNVSVRMA